MIVGYARVSSIDQNLDRQTTQLNAHGVQRLITDKMSGKDLHRPGFDTLKEEVKPGDTLIVVSMDRLSRSLQDLLGAVNFFSDKGVKIKFLKENIEITPGNASPISKLLLGIMGAVAEFERNLIRERQREGIVKRYRIWLALQTVKEPRFTRWKTAEYEPGAAEYEALTNASAALLTAQALLSEIDCPHAEKMHAARDWLRDVFGAWVDDKTHEIPP